MSRTTTGHLLIADISGYTQYLTSSELEHALRKTIESEMADGALAIPEPNDGIASEIEAAVISSLASDRD